MTATAITEAEEFADIYDLEVIVIPTNLPVIRKDYPDRVYRTIEGKFRAVVDEIKQLHEKERPVLVGTTSVENSEILSQMLNKEGVPHNVLNAKHHEKEAKIVANAGQKGQVTIATNMAGRGTDIALGEGVKDLGGLHVIGTERHESRRIDNQLRGRSGRQGDPGSSRFYVSFEDDLMRLFGGNTMSSLMSQVGMDDSTPIEAGMIGRTIESAQKRVENHHFDIRKHLVQYDNVLSQQRDIIYDLRLKILTILEREKERLKTNKDGVDFDYKRLDREFIQNLADDIQNFSIKDPGTWDVEAFTDKEILQRPLRLWVLRMAFEQADYVVAAQMRDDMQVDDVEERNIMAEITDIIPKELAEGLVKKIGYKSLEEFETKFYEVDNPEEQKQMFYTLITAAYIAHADRLGDSALRELERSLILQTMDNLWMEHLDAMTDLRHGITLRGYAQKNPLVEYKNEGFDMFDRMLAQMKDIITKRFFKVKVVESAPQIDMRARKAVRQARQEADNQSKDNKSQPDQTSKRKLDMPKKSFTDKRPGNVSKTKTVVKPMDVGRNDPCPCGSGKKYKKCCYPKYE
jgi:preprotein translocase subunit SecA